MNNSEKTINWYIRLHDKFFSDREIQAIERLPESKYGKNFSSFVIHLYFKMLCESIQTDGKIIFRPAFEENEDIAYSLAMRFFSHGKLAEIKYALNVLLELGMIEMMPASEGPALFIPGVVANTGKASLGADKKRARLAAAKKELIEEDTKNTYGRCNNIELSTAEYNTLLNSAGKEVFDKALEEVSCLKAIGSITSDNDYQILQSVLADKT